MSRIGAPAFTIEGDDGLWPLVFDLSPLTFSL
jgi:hypothetical protein